MQRSVNKIYPVILAGGAGSRLAPLSSPEKPKQFLDLLDNGKTMLETTLERFQHRVFHKPVIITNKAFQPLVEATLTQSNIEIDNVLYEQKAAGTALAITLALKYVNKKEEGAYALICPSDHYLSNAQDFQNGVFKAYQTSPALHLFGVKPEYTHTGYGYIHAQNEKVLGFVEKPDEDTAKHLSASDNHFWNSGIFLINTDQTLKLINKHLPSIYAAAETIWKNKAIYNNHIDFDAAENIEPISIDKGLLQKLNCMSMSILSCEWSDLGTWDTLEAYKKKHIY